MARIRMARNTKGKWDEGRRFRSREEYRKWLRTVPDPENWEYIEWDVPEAIDWKGLGFLDPEEISDGERRAPETKQRRRKRLPEK